MAWAWNINSKLKTTIHACYLRRSYLESPGKQSFKNKIKMLVTNAAWVMKIAWKSCPAILITVLSSQLIISAVPAGLAWAGRCLINVVSDEVMNGTGDFNRVLPWLLTSLGLTLVNEVFGNISSYFNIRMREKISLAFDIDILKHGSQLDISYFEDPEFQDIALRATQNSSQHVIGFLNKVIVVSSNFLKIVGLISILFIIDPVIVLTITPLVIPFLGFKWHQSKARFNKEYARATKRRLSGYFSSLLKNRVMILEVKLLKLAPSLIEKYKNLKIDFIKEDRRIYTREFIGNFVFYSVFAVLFYILFARISIRVMDGHLTIGDIAVFAGATRQLFSILTSIATQISGIMEGMLFVENLVIFFEAEPRIKSTSDLTLTDCRGALEFQNVFFKYPGSEKNILRNISFKIKPGETIAIVGRNGAGKSTLVKLIARFYDPDDGRILLDNHNVKKLSLDWLQRSISFVFQSPSRYEGSVKENIMFGNITKTFDLAELKKIAHMAGAHPMIEEMPDKYNTILGRKFGEHDLSGGQWQKIAIARAAARHNSSILILDEPAAGLDAQAKADLISNFRELAENKTTISDLPQVFYIGTGRQDICIGKR